MAGIYRSDAAGVRTAVGLLAQRRYDGTLVRYGEPVATTPVDLTVPRYIDEPYAVSSPWKATLRDGITYHPPTDLSTISARAPKGTLNPGPAWAWATWYGSDSDELVPVTNPAGDVVYYYVRFPAGAKFPTPLPPSEGDRWVTWFEPGRSFGIDHYKATPVYGPDGVTVVRITVSRQPRRSVLTGDGVYLDTEGIAGTPGTSGMRASYLPYAGGALRKREALAKVIRHAIAFALPDSSLANVTPLWPARGKDSNAATAYSGDTAMGTRFAIPPTVDLTTLGLSPEGLALGAALQRHGAYVVDRSSSGAITVEMVDDAAPDAAAYRAALDRYKAAWIVLNDQLVRVTGHTANLPGGPGQLRWPDPPAAVL